MKVLVVGGAGYVGGAVTDVLQKTNHQTRVYDALLYEECYRKQVDFISGDVRDRERLQPHLDWADVTIWLAALVGDPACALNPEVSIEINQKSVKWLSEHFDGRIAVPDLPVPSTAPGTASWMSLRQPIHYPFTPPPSWKRNDT